VDYQHLSANELITQIEQTQQKEAELQRALQRRRQEEKKELALEIRDIIKDRGHDVDEIADLIMPPSRRRRSAAVANRGDTGGYTRYVDPENPGNVYTRGVLPGWMKQKMIAAGLDPSDKADRDNFKANHLNAVSD
jgi:DNA-binding protein H-NS